VSKSEAFKKKQKASARAQNARDTHEKGVVAHLNGKCPVPGCGRPFIFVEGHLPFCDDCQNFLQRMVWLLNNVTLKSTATGEKAVPLNEKLIKNEEQPVKEDLPVAQP
jgi:predicted anti-sigma-YlaC factor YlaD